MSENNGLNYLPAFDRPFSQRIKEGWDKFSQGEEKLREMIKSQESGDDITAYCQKLLGSTFSEVYFELGYNGEKYELILAPEKEKYMLYLYEAFKRQAPQNILEHWNIILGRNYSASCNLGFHGKTVSPKDISIKIKKEENSKSCNIVGFCEKLVPVLKDDRNEAFWFFDMLLDMTVGEIVNMRYIETIDMTDKPFADSDNAIPLEKLPEAMEEMFGNKEGWNSVESYLECYNGYRMEPNDNPEGFIPRDDIYVGFSSMPEILNCYYNKDNYYIEKAIKDGAPIGFIFYPIDQFIEEADRKRSDVILDFRDELEQYINEKTNGSACRIIGGATGIYCSYLDFIAWDLKAVLDTAKEFFEDKKLVEWADFQIYSMESESVNIYE